MFGDRFKVRLPKFIGQIPDMNDLFIAEDREFMKIEDELKEFSKSMIINNLGELKNPIPVIYRYEDIFGLSHASELSIQDRINRIIIKLLKKETTNEEAILRMVRLFDGDPGYIRDYENYSFTLKVKSKLEGDAKRILNNAISEIVPAHLTWQYWFIIYTWGTAFKIGEVDIDRKKLIWKDFRGLKWGANGHKWGDSLEFGEGQWKTWGMVRDDRWSTYYAEGMTNV
ncbi:MAG: hypothetical protein GXZ08_02490 [Tissierellia bacterium]|nr:hypothetical protein [Tissierellia bacterium]